MKNIIANATIKSIQVYKLQPYEFRVTLFVAGYLRFVAAFGSTESINLFNNYLSNHEFKMA